MTGAKILKHLSYSGNNEVLVLEFQPYMETQQRSLIFTAFVGLVILAIIIGSIYYLVKFIQDRQRTASDSQAVSSPIPSGQIPFASENPQDSLGETGGGTTGAQANTKTYSAGDVQMIYPNNWGLLTCSNSLNFEFDPKNPEDSQVVCSLAQKPVTILVNDSTGCAGDLIDIGPVKVQKQMQEEEGYRTYQWCTQTSPRLNISHRSSTYGAPATSPEDYSKQVEEMISRLSFVRGS
jgi:hypothetical protein